MNPIVQRFRDVFGAHPGWLVLGAAVALTALGILAIDTTEALGGTSYARSQVQWLVIAIVFTAFCMIPHPRMIGAASYPLMIAVLLTLVFMVMPFAPRWLVPVRNGARCWIDLGPMNVQPAEFAKIFFVLAVARYLRYRENYRTFLGMLIPFVLMLVPVGLILKQPDLGTAMLFAPALFAMLIAAGAKLRHLGALAGLGVLAVASVVAICLWAPDDMQVLKPHQRQRIVSMISLAQGDDRFNQTTAFQQAKSMDLIGAGGVRGYGADRAAVVVRFNKLPEDHNDMIFAVIVNRWGFLGGLTVIGLYVVMFAGFLAAAGRAKDPFVRLVTVGFAGVIFCQASINIGMTIGLLPITGITLPFVSYGGSSLVTTFAMVGLVANFASRRPAFLTRPSFEFGKAEAAAG